MVFIKREKNMPDNTTPKHIQDNSKPTYSLCGVYIGFSWSFTSIDHWFLSRIHNNRLTACKKCIVRIKIMAEEGLKDE